MPSEGGLVGDPLRRDLSTRPVDLGTYDASGLVTSAFEAPKLHWRLTTARPNVGQIAYELQRCPSPTFLENVHSSGRVEAITPLGASWLGTPLASREVTWLRVRIWTDQGVTHWSEPLRLEGGLYCADDWLARPVSPPANVDQALPCPVPLLRRTLQPGG